MGPFKYSTATADTIELVRDDNWAGPATACGGKACLDGVTYKFFGDKEGEEAAFLAGEIDVALDLQQADYDAIKGVAADVGKALDAPAWEYEHLDMNEAGLGQGKGHPALQDPIVRKAIEQAIDKKAVLPDRVPGRAVPGQQPVHERHPVELLAAPGREVPGLRRRGGQRRARRRRLHQGRRRDPGRSEVEASARVRALHVVGRLSASSAPTSSRSR